MRRRLAVAASLLCLISAASTAQPAAGVSRSALFHGFLAQHFSGSRDEAPDASYDTAWYDLNGDGRPEVLVYLEAPIWCGPHGCDLLIFTADGTSWRRIDEISAGRTPIRVLERRHRGWRDLSLYVSDSLAPGRQRILSFDGRRYQLVPGQGRGRDRGRLLIGTEGPGTPLFQAMPADPR